LIVTYTTIMTGCPQHRCGALEEDHSVGGQLGESFLHSVPLLSLPRLHPRVLTLAWSDPLAQALSLLAGHHFMSAPVRDANGTLVGMVTINDLASAVVNIADAATKTAGSADPVSSMQSLWNASTVGEIMNVSGRSAFAVLPYDASLWDALERLGKGGAHSVVVMNENGSGPEALYSQGAVLEYLFQHLDRFSSIARRLVHQIGSFSQVGSQKPLYISEEDTLLSGLRLLHEQGVTGLMVINHRRKLMGVISASDVRMLGANLEGCAHLFSPAGQFVRQVQQQSSLLLSKIVSNTPVDTVGMVMEKMLDNSVHRVFIVRTHHGMEEEIPFGVLSMRDILMLFQPDHH